MLSIEECRKYLGKDDLTDKEVEQLRNSLYLMIGSAVDHHLEKTNEKNNNN